MKRGIWGFVFVLATMVGVVLSLSVADAQTRFRLGVDNDALSMDPIASSDNPSIWVQLLLYDTLVRPSTDALKVEPGLAERWTVSPDGLEYTFQLTADTKILPAERADQLAVGSLVTLIAPRDPSSEIPIAKGIVIHPAGSGSGAFSTP